MSSKQHYRRLCSRPDVRIPLFSMDWWLDAVCGESAWDVVLYEKQGEILGTLPFYMRSLAFNKIITMPTLTQTMGPWFARSDFKHYSSKLEYEKKVSFFLIDHLPRCKFFYQNFHYSIQNWLPFYWRGFQQTTRYTYVLDSLEDPDALYAEFSYAKKKNIKKANREVTVKFDLPADVFYQHHRESLKRLGKKISYSYDLFHRLYRACYQRNAGRTIYALDRGGNIHSALFVIWDAYSAYDLISTIDPRYRSSGSATLLVWEMIKYLADKTEKFDFEGSMNEGVENSFRQFGAVQKPYFKVTKSFSFVVGVLKAIRDLMLPVS